LHLASCILHLASCILHLASCILHLLLSLADGNIFKCTLELFLLDLLDERRAI